MVPSAGLTEVKSMKLLSTALIVSAWVMPASAASLTPGTTNACNGITSLNNFVLGANYSFYTYGPTFASPCTDDPAYAGAPGIFTSGTLSYGIISKQDERWSFLSVDIAPASVNQNFNLVITFVGYTGLVTQDFQGNLVGNAVAVAAFPLPDNGPFQFTTVALPAGFASINTLVVRPAFVQFGNLNVLAASEAQPTPEPASASTAALGCALLAGMAGGVRLRKKIAFHL
jgi:hypothetical protein